MKKKFIWWGFIALFLLPYSAWAEQSSYVLPYPSSMPGSSLYFAHQTLEKLSKFWYFGDFAQFKYNLKYSDKYLVEAKTLFEYRQYLLASDSLNKSNYYFEKLNGNLLRAKENGKNISEKEKMLKLAAEKHKEVLLLIKNTTPPSFNWRPEKEESRLLNLHKLIDYSFNLRKL